MIQVFLSLPELAENYDSWNNDLMRTQENVRVQVAVPSTTVLDNGGRNNRLQDNQGRTFHVSTPLPNTCFHEKAGLRCLPSLLYIGVGHAGSTALWKSLSMHPQLEPNTAWSPNKPGREGSCMRFQMS